VRDHFVRFNLLREAGDIHGDRKFQYEHWPKMIVWHQELGESRVNEDSAEDQAAEPDDGAAGVEWAGLHHELSFAAKERLFLT
jgi:hypothetical protein